MTTPDSAVAGTGPHSTSTKAKTPDWLLLAVACTAQFMVVLDVTVVNVALPAMKASLGLSITDQQWIINAYTLTFGGLLLLGGRAADLFGRKRTFLIGLALFSISSLAGGFAQSGSFLILARAVQGIGGAILAPSTLSLLTSTFVEPKERAKALTIWGTTAASGAAMGSVVGGILTDLTSWRSVLFVNVPIGIAVIAVATRALVESKGQLKGVRSLDLPGAFTVTGGLGLLIYGIVTTNTHAWGSFHTVSYIVAGFVLLAAFFLIELKSTTPLMPLRLFRNHSLRGGNAVAFLVGTTIVGFLFFLSLFIQQIDGYSPLRAGLALLPSAVGTFTAATLTGRIVVKTGPKRILMVGAIIAGVGVLWLSQLHPGEGYLAHILAPSFLTGLGMGCCFVPMTIAGTTGVERKDAGIASGLINTTRQIGSALGLAALATVASSATDHILAAHRGVPSPALLASSLASGFDRGFLIDGILVLSIAAVAGLLLPPRQPKPAHELAANT